MLREALKKESSSFLLLVARPRAPSSVLAPSSDARSPALRCYVEVGNRLGSSTSL